jgi:hypothetical protein
MLAATQKTLITALAAAAGLAAIALAPATALADLPSAQAAQAADARAAAAALLAGPKDRSQGAHRTARRDADPTDRIAGNRNATEGSTVDSNPFNANGEDELPRAAAVTAGTDDAERQIVRTVRRKPKRRVRRRVRRRY